jgi:GTP-binding protein
MSQMKYLKSAVHPVDFPEADRPEVAIAGRSNAGKSSFLNVIAKSKVAHVSQTPGKTRLLNFFDFGQHYRFVDMPGYGFAARSGDEIVDWTKMIETYLSIRENLRGLVLIMDSRRDWSKDEEVLKKFCNKIGLPMCVVLTKGDKCSNKERAGFLKKIKASSELATVFMTSAQTEEGIKEVEEFIYRDWILTSKKADQ